MQLPSLLAIASLALSVMAAPTSEVTTLLPARSEDVTSAASSEVVGGDDLDKRCTWNDGHGPISCVVFGAEGRYRNQFVIKGNNFEKYDHMRCPLGQFWDFQSFTSPLPFVLVMRPGNTCAAIDPSMGWWDGLHIRYSNTELNPDKDTRCGPVDNGWGRRCIIAQRP